MLPRIAPAAALAVLVAGIPAAGAGAAAPAPGTARLPAQATVAVPVTRISGAPAAHRIVLRNTSRRTRTLTAAPLKAAYAGPGRVTVSLVARSSQRHVRVRLVVGDGTRRHVSVAREQLSGRRAERLHRTHAVPAASAGVRIRFVARAVRPGQNVVVRAVRVAGQRTTAPRPKAPRRPARAAAVPSSTAGPGAHLPLVYDRATLRGRVVYVAKNGRDSNPGTLGAPYATVAAAISRTPAGTPTHVVVRRGTYTEGNIVIPANKSIDIVAYPRELVEFSGAQPLVGGWAAEGALRYHSYAPQPVNYGSGLFDAGGFAKAVAQYPDQVWQGNRTLVQVLSKSQVAPGRFFVDRARRRVYLHTNDQRAGAVQASAKARFLRILGSNSSLRGVRVKRYSNSLNDYGVVRIEHTTDRTRPLSNILLANVEILGSAMQAVQVMVTDAGGYPRTYPADIIKGVTFRHVTIADSNWMGIASNWTDNLTLDKVKITTSNMAGEFRFSPQSGALKTSRNRNIVVRGSVIANNNSHGLWFDQSNYGAIVARSWISGNSGSAVFWEISDRFLLIDSYVRVPAHGVQAVKIAGASGVNLVNNTLIGGKDVVGVYTDNRSKPGCANAAKPLCASSYGSDRDGVRPRPATMDWMPRIDRMVDNIIAYPTGSGYCGGTAGLCLTTSNAGATTSLRAILHPADPARGIPATLINGNVYANGSGAIVRAGAGAYRDITAWRRALMAGFQVAGDEAVGRSGNAWVTSVGKQSAALRAVNRAAAPVPAHAAVNLFVPAGHRYYGLIP